MLMDRTLRPHVALLYDAVDVGLRRWGNRAHACDASRRQVWVGVSFGAVGARRGALVRPGGAVRARGVSYGALERHKSFNRP